MSDITYPCYIERKDNRGHWYWIYYASNREEIASSSESYVNRSDCERSIQLVKGSAAHKVWYFD